MCKKKKPDRCPVGEATFSEEGRALPAPEAQLLLVLAAESSRLPSNTQVHLAWAWRFATLPDGYIPASAQEALLHVYMGERAAASLLQDVAASHRDPDPASTLEGGSPAPEVLQSLLLARASLTASGFAPPSWPQLWNTSAPRDEEDEPQLDTTRGWQRPASKAVDEFGFRSIHRELDPPAAALLDSQAGPFAARIFTARPTSPELSLAPSHFRVLLLRRLRLPLPLAAAYTL